MHMDDFLFAGGFFFVFVLGGLLLLALFIAALVSIANHPYASGTEKGLWVLIALVFPVLGPICGS